MKMIPLYDKLIVIPIQQAEKTKSGLFIPDSGKEKPNQGRVLHVGNGKMDEKGNFAPMQVKPDDIVLYSKFSGSEVTLDGELLLIMEEADILAIVQE